MPREYDATRAPSVVAIGTYTSHTPALVSTRSGPAMPSGTCANPTRFSIFPRASSSATGRPATCAGRAPEACAHSARRRSAAVLV